MYNINTLGDNMTKQDLEYRIQNLQSSLETLKDRNSVAYKILDIRLRLFKRQLKRVLKLGTSFTTK